MIRKPLLSPASLLTFLGQRNFLPEIQINIIIIFFSSFKHTILPVHHLPKLSNDVQD